MFRFRICVRRLVVIMCACFTRKLLVNRSIRSHKNHFDFAVFSPLFFWFVTWWSREEKRKKQLSMFVPNEPVNSKSPVDLLSENKYVYCPQHAYNTHTEWERHLNAISDNNHRLHCSHSLSPQTLSVSQPIILFFNFTHGNYEWKCVLRGSIERNEKKIMLHRSHMSAQIHAVLHMT